MRQKSAGDKCLQEEGRFNTAGFFLRGMAGAAGPGGTFLSNPGLLPLARMPRPLPLRVPTTAVAV